MGKESKTARASAVKTVGEKIVIPDDVLIKNLRNEVANGLYPTIQGSHALLREYDKLIESHRLLAEQINTLANFITTNVPGEPSLSEGAVETAIRLLKGVYEARAVQKRAVDEAPYADELVTREEPFISEPGF